MIKTTINDFDGYFYNIANCHLNNFGAIYLDDFGNPIELDDMYYMLDDIDDLIENYSELELKNKVFEYYGGLGIEMMRLKNGKIN